MLGVDLVLAAAFLDGQLQTERAIHEVVADHVHEDERIALPFGVDVEHLGELLGRAGIRTLGHHHAHIYRNRVAHLELGLGHGLAGDGLVAVLVQAVLDIGNVEVVHADNGAVTHVFLGGRTDDNVVLGIQARDTNNHVTLVAGIHLLAVLDFGLVGPKRVLDGIVVGEGGVNVKVLVLQGLGEILRVVTIGNDKKLDALGLLDNRVRAALVGSG